jgi:hypothetical protein
MVQDSGPVFLSITKRQVYVHCPLTRLVVYVINMNECAFITVFCASAGAQSPDIFTDPHMLGELSTYVMNAF